MIFFEKLYKFRLKRKVLKRMILHYQDRFEQALILEQWIIKRILDGQTERRKELAEKQAEIKETIAFIKFLKEYK